MTTVAFQLSGSTWLTRNRLAIALGDFIGIRRMVVVSRRAPFVRVAGEVSHAQIDPMSPVSWYHGRMAHLGKKMHNEVCMAGPLRTARF